MQFSGDRKLHCWLTYMKPLERKTMIGLPCVNRCPKKSKAHAEILHRRDSKLTVTGPWTLPKESFPPAQRIRRNAKFCV